MIADELSRRSIDDLAAAAASETFSRRSVTAVDHINQVSRLTYHHSRHHQQTSAYQSSSSSSNSWQYHHAASVPSAPAASYGLVHQQSSPCESSSSRPISSVNFSSRGVFDDARGVISEFPATKLQAEIPQQRCHYVHSGVDGSSPRGVHYSTPGMADAQYHKMGILREQGLHQQC